MDDPRTLSIRSEELVCRWIGAFWGIEVSPNVMDSSYRGPDITLPNGDHVEVKRVNTKCKTIGKLSCERQKDKWLALVWSDREVVVVPMSRVISNFAHLRTKRRTSVRNLKPGSPNAIPPPSPAIGLLMLPSSGA